MQPLQAVNPRDDGKDEQQQEKSPQMTVVAPSMSRCTAMKLLGRLHRLTAIVTEELNDHVVLTTYTDTPTQRPQNLMCDH
jgi:hypothetical protein